MHENMFGSNGTKSPEKLHSFYITNYTKASKGGRQTMMPSFAAYGPQLAAWHHDPKGTIVAHMICQ